MYHLPEELVRYIYEFDNTYREIFNEVLKSRYEIYQKKDTKSFLVFDEFSGRSFITDSLQNPTWKTTHHTHKNKNTKGDSDLYLENFKTKMKTLYPLQKVSDNLQYDIHESLFS